MSKRLAPSVLIVLIVPLGSCSTYMGEKLDFDGSLAKAKSGGIPYVMTQPEYTLTRDDLATPARYTLKVGSVPDPSQRYALRLSPVITSAVTFNMDLGPDGELISASNKLTDQIVPTVKALFSFILTTVGTVAKVASPVRALNPSRPTDTLIDCLDEPTEARQAYCAIGLQRKPAHRQRGRRSKLGLRVNSLTLEERWTPIKQSPTVARYSPACTIWTETSVRVCSGQRRTFGAWAKI